MIWMVGVRGATISPDGSLIAYTKGGARRDDNNPKFNNFGDLYIMDSLGKHVQKNSNRIQCYDTGLF